VHRGGRGEHDTPHGRAGGSRFQDQLRAENICRKAALRITVAIRDEVQGREVDDDLRFMLTQSVWQRLPVSDVADDHLHVARQ
jgi:hypothetical protein